jgi:hypothetical protein
MAFCSNCGVPTVPGAIVCAQCGHALSLAPPPVTYARPPAPTAPAFATPSGFEATPPMSARKKSRPVGIAILSVLQWIGAGVLVLYGIVLTFLGPTLLTSLRSDQSLTADQQAALEGIGPLFVALGVMCFAFAGLSIWIGWGLWTGKNWARVTHIVLASVSGGFTAVAAVTALVTLPPLGVVYLLFVAWYAFVIWYCTRPGVKEYYTPVASVATPNAPTW